MMDDSVRLFVEECDSLQVLPLTSSSNLCRLFTRES